MITTKNLSIKGAITNNGLIFAVIHKHKETLQAQRKLFPLHASKKQTDRKTQTNFPPTLDRNQSSQIKSKWKSGFVHPIHGIPTQKYY